LEVVDWIHLAQDREKWWTVGYIKNLKVPWSIGNFFLLVEELLASQQGLCSMELVRFVSSVLYVSTCFSLYCLLFPPKWCCYLICTRCVTAGSQFYTKLYKMSGITNTYIRLI
jgi:hypothetical protein